MRTGRSGARCGALGARASCPPSIQRARRGASRSTGPFARRPRLSGGAGTRSRPHLFNRSASHFVNIRRARCPRSQGPTSGSASATALSRPSPRAPHRAPLRPLRSPGLLPGPHIGLRFGHCAQGLLPGPHIGRCAPDRAGSAGDVVPRSRAGLSPVTTCTADTLSSVPGIFRAPARLFPSVTCATRLPPSSHRSFDAGKAPVPGSA
jgi:hypothetical protein